MRVAIGLEDCIANTSQLFEEWQPRIGSDCDSFFDPQFIRNESFWRAQKPILRGDLIMEALGHAELFVFTGRPPDLLGITRSWLRKYDYRIDDDHIVFKTMKRYDCRLNKINYYVDTDLSALEDFVYDATIPVYLGSGAKINNKRIIPVACEADIGEACVEIDYGNGWI